MYTIPREIKELLEIKIADVIAETGRTLVRGSIELTPHDYLYVSFNQSWTNDRWASPCNYGYITVEYTVTYKQRMTRRIKVLFDWQRIGTFDHRATAFRWSDVQSEKLKAKVAEVCKYAERHIALRRERQLVEGDFESEVRDVFPEAEIDGMKATVADDLEIRRNGDCFEGIITISIQGGLQEISAIVNAVREAASAQSTAAH